MFLFLVFLRSNYAGERKKVSKRPGSVANNEVVTSPRVIRVIPTVCGVCIGAILLVYCCCITSVLLLCYWCFATVLMVYYCCITGVLLLYHWCIAAVLLMYC